MAKKTLTRVQIAVKGSDEYGDWVRALAIHRHLDVATMIHASLCDTARMAGFAPPPPRSAPRTIGVKKK